MQLEYIIRYKTENHYENDADDAHWQFLIIPEQNNSQEFIEVDFSNSLDALNQYSINGYGFKTIRVHPKMKFKSISFEGTFRLLKKEMNPFDFKQSQDITKDYAQIQSLIFKIDFEPFLKKTPLTELPKQSLELFVFDKNLSLFENLQKLNEWTFQHLYFKSDVTTVKTTLAEIIDKRHGVCQDFTHLFCALARQNGIPTRYVSGYLNQGNGYFGDSQMHAWSEAYIPNVGWVGFDSTNNLLASINHIKVCHGKDYTDCSPLKGIVYVSGGNKTKQSVQVASQQQ